VELLAVTSTLLPYFMSGLMYVLYVVFIVCCVFPHLALASRFMSLSIWLTLFIVCSTWFFHDSLLSMCIRKYFVLSLFGRFWLLIFSSKLVIFVAHREELIDCLGAIYFRIVFCCPLREIRAVFIVCSKVLCCLALWLVEARMTKSSAYIPKLVLMFLTVCMFGMNLVGIVHGRDQKYRQAFDQEA
jgi:hypothetical protein